MEQIRQNCCYRALSLRTKEFYTAECRVHVFLVSTSNYFNK